MLKTFRNIFLKPEHRRAQTPVFQKATFILRFEHLDVGQLWHEDGVWHFEYLDSFRKQSDVRPLTDFPKIDKVYSSDELWPFFAVRIPGLGQPSVIRVIKEENIDSENEIELLKRFGKMTVANPFELEKV